MKLIELHKQWMETGKIENIKNSNGDGGLCNATPKKYLPLLKLFEPTDDFQAYWASEADLFDATELAAYGYNKLRQTIVLLICAMCDEL